MSSLADVTIPDPARLRAFLRAYPRIAGDVAVTVGSFVVLGWWIDPLDFARTPGGPMPGNTAVMTVLAGVALWLAWRAPVARSARTVVVVCATIVTALAVATLLEYATGSSFGIDELVVAPAIPWPNRRPSPQAALAFAFVGSALLVLDRTVRGRQPADYLALAALAITIAALLGYLFKVPAMYGVPQRPGISISVPAGVTLVLLATGVLAARVDRGVVAVVLAPDWGGVAARGLLVGLLVFPVIVLMLVAGVHAGLYPRTVASALVVFAALAEGTWLILATANRLSRMDAAARRASASLRASEERVRGLLQHASDPIIVCDRDGRLAEVNAAAGRLVGCAAEELLGTSVLDLFTADERPRAAAARAQMATSAASFVAEWKIQRRDGSTTVVEIHAKPFPDGSAQAIMRDITERKRVEEARAEAAELERAHSAWMQTVIDQLPSGVLVLDAQGGVRAMNRAFRALASGDPRGVDPWGNAIEFDVRDGDGKELPFDELPVVTALRTGEATRERVLQVRQRDGRMVPISATAVPLRDGTGAVTGAVAVTADITERVELERLRQEWVAVVAHDLRQPVNTVMLSVERLQSLLRQGTLADKAPTAIERIRDAGWRLNRMIEDLLDAARIQAHRLTIECRAADLVALVETDLETTRLAHPDATLRLDATPGQLAWIDPDRVHQVVANLLSNAIKYGAPGAAIDVAITSDDASAHVCVTNAGADIPPDELARLFTRFTRTRDARASGKPGIGLGLYICKGLIEAQGGRMWADSGGGRTRFHFTVPKPPG